MDKMLFGIPYVGSKARIGKELISKMLELKPQAHIFIDLFGGGGGMSYNACQFPNFDKIIYNDLNYQVYNAINFLNKNIIDGTFIDFYNKLESTIINRDQFFNLDLNDPFSFILNRCYSFGNKGDTYIYSKDKYEEKLIVESFILDPEKYYEEFKSLGYLDKTFNYNYFKHEDLLTRKRYLQKYLEPKNYYFMRFQARDRIEHFKTLNLIKKGDIEKIKTYNLPYDKVPLEGFNEDEVIIYCDPPYEEADYYRNKDAFDNKALYEWAINNKFLVFISSYRVSDERLKEVYSLDIINSMGAKNKHEKEKLFINKDIKIKKIKTLF